MDGCPQNSDSWRTLWPFLHLPHGPFATWLRGNRSKITGARLGTQIAALDQVEESMLKMSACVSAAFMAGLISVGCSGSGLKGGGGSAGAGGEVKGGQAGSTMSSGTAGGTGGAIGGSTTGGPIGATGGVADGSGGSIGVGGVGSGGTSGGTGGTISCLPALCSMPACAGDIQPNPDNPCGCPICVPNPDAGATKDAGSPDFPAYCELVDCGIERPCSSGYVRSTDLCGCPICAPVDAGIAKDTSQDSFVCSGPMPPCVPPPQDLSRWVPAGLSALRLHRMYAGGRWNQRRWEAGHAGDLLRDVPNDCLHLRIPAESRALRLFHLRPAP